MFQKTAIMNAILQLVIMLIIVRTNNVKLKAFLRQSDNNMPNLSCHKDFFLLHLFKRSVLEIDKQIRDVVYKMLGTNL